MRVFKQSMYIISFKSLFNQIVTSFKLSLFIQDFSSLFVRLEKIISCVQGVLFYSKYSFKILPLQHWDQCPVQVLCVLTFFGKPKNTITETINHVYTFFCIINILLLIKNSACKYVIIIHFYSSKSIKSVEIHHHICEVQWQENCSEQLKKRCIMSKGIIVFWLDNAHSQMAFEIKTSHHMISEFIGFIKFFDNTPWTIWF